MFIIDLTYIKPISEVEKYLQEHIHYLEKYYQTGDFVMSGRKNPRSGGVIIAQTTSLETLKAIYQQDPFFIHHIAEYNITHFTPSKWNHALNDLLG